MVKGNLLLKDRSKGVAYESGYSCFQPPNLLHWLCKAGWCAHKENQFIFLFFPLKFVGRVTKPNYLAYFYKLLDI